jgi:hypothetical protein
LADQVTTADDRPIESSSELRVVERRVDFAVIAAFAVLALLCAWLSDGFVAADACTHYLLAKYAFADPVNLVDVWGRPLCTLIEAVPARIGGRLAVRIVSIAIAIGCALVARAIARDQGLTRPGLALLFTLGAPLFFLFSFSEMTELPFALVLGAAVLCYRREKWLSFALLSGLLPAARPEGFGFVILAAIALLVKRRWLALLPLIAPLLAWDSAGWILTNRPGPWYAWLVQAWPWSEQGLYGRGNLFSFVAVLPVIVPPLVLPATLIGIGRSLSPRPIMANAADSTARHKLFCQFVIAAIPVGILVGHSVLRWLGKFGTFGEARYLLICAPLWGVVSASGWEWMSSRLQWRRAWRWAVLLVAAPAIINFVDPVVPIHLGGDWQTARRFADVYRNKGLERVYPHVIAAHPAIPYFMGIDPTRNGREDAFTSARIKGLPQGALLVWDPVYCTTNAIAEDAATPDEIRGCGWVEAPDLADEVNNRVGSNRWKIFKSPHPLARP